VAYSRDWYAVSVVPVAGGDVKPLGPSSLGCGWDDAGRLYFVTWPDAQWRSSDYCWWYFE